MKKSRLIRIAAATAGPLVLLLTLVVIAPSSAGAATVGTGSSGGSVPALHLVYEAQSNAPFPGLSGEVQPNNTALGICPNTTVGSDCTVDWIQSRGTSATYFEYYDVSTGTIESLPPYYAECGSSTCSYSLVGGGPGAIPDGWVVEASPNQVVSIIQVTEP